jgi:rubrerythrin
MKLPNRYRAKGIDDGNWYEGYYLQFPETTPYWFNEEDRERNPPEIIHGLVWPQMTDWGFPNSLRWVKIDPDTLKERKILSNNVSETEEKFGTKKGKWIDTDNYYYRWQCSECGMYTREPEPNFCPWCGTDMRNNDG